MMETMLYLNTSYDVMYGNKNNEKITKQKFSWHETLKPSTTILKTDQAVLMRGSMSLSIYDYSFSLLFITASVSEVARMPRAEKVKCS